MSRSFVSLVVFVLLLAAGSALWLGACEERVENQVVGFQGEAKRNKYLAALRLLEAVRPDVRAFENERELDGLPPTDGTLLLLTNRNERLGEARSHELLDWVREGGHLVVITWSLWRDPERSPDLVLDRLGVRQHMWSDEELAERAPEESDGWTARVALPDRSEPLSVEFDPKYHLELVEPERERFAISDVGGTHLLTVAEGAGYVTTLTDDYFLTNDFIGDEDHAELVYRLAHLFGRDGAVWLVWSDAVAPWWRLVWRHGWTVVVSLAALVVLWLGVRVPRFGPLAPDAPRDRRELMEHIDAVGRFQLAHGAGAELASSVREALVARLRQRHPALAKLDPREQAERLAELSGIPAERIARALAPGRERDDERFAARIATLQRIRKAL